MRSAFPADLIVRCGIREVVLGIHIRDALLLNRDAFEVWAPRQTTCQSFPTMTSSCWTVMKEIETIRYKIGIEPDLERFLFSGTTEISLEANRVVREISLNALELAVWGCKIHLEGEDVECSFSVHPKKEVVTVHLPREISGKILMKIHYMGKINDKMAGFYRSQYGRRGKTGHLALTQFEESDARRAFPCFDHPLKKAVFDIEMTIDEHLVAISNCPIQKERLLGNGKKQVTFLQTPRMSTYLVFFGVGPFEFVEDPGDVLLRAATAPGMKQYARYGLEFGRKSLAFCEEYYRIKFPLPKLDLVAIPDFAFGAMENWGAITFRENLFLHDPDITSKTGEERICGVIAHEMVHQWFGNLVTPSDWKYLWLNESFATYFGYHVIDHYEPDWQAWELFLQSQTEPALHRDALHETCCIEIPGGDHVVINASTAPIIYNKGGSILRQVEGYIGSERFKEGVRHYLRKHQYANAASEDLWQALEAVSEKPVTKMMKSWVEQPGYPLIQAKRDGQQLFLLQKRFTYLPNESTQHWLLPITVGILLPNGETRSVTALMEDRGAILDLGAPGVPYKVNYGQTGFYRVKYEERKDLEDLGKLIANKRLPAPDRWGLENDLYALLRSGDVPLDDYLAFLSHYLHEDAFLPLMSIAENLFHAYLILQDADREKVADAGRSILGGVLRRIGYEPEPEENPTVSMLRDSVLWYAVLFDSKDAQEFGQAKFSSLMKGSNIHRDIMKSVMQIGAFYGDRNVFDWFDERLDTSDSEHERMNVLAALGKFRDRELIGQVQDYILDKVPNRNRFVPIGSMALNPDAAPRMWDWFTSRIHALEQFHPLHYERVLAAIIPYGGLEREQEVKDFFVDYLKTKDQARDVIQLSLETLEVHSRMRRKVNSSIGS